MRIRAITIHDGSRVPGLGGTVSRALGMFPVRCQIVEWPGIDAEAARIYDTRAPFGRQPESGEGAPLYDGEVLQVMMAGMIPGSESGTDSLHVVLYDRLACTFDGGDCRYHARALVASNPAVISIPGIVEAPARPREYYVDAATCGTGGLDARYVGRYLRHGDPGIADAAGIYAAQAVMYYETGEAFCADAGCMMYNAHWQEELLSHMRRRQLCGRHRAALGSM